MPQDVTMENLTQVVRANSTIVATDKYGTQTKPIARHFYEFENLAFWPYGYDSFGGAMFWNILNGFSSIYKWEGLPDEIPSQVFEKNLISSGRMKMVEIMGKAYAVHISPQEWDLYFNTIKSTIIEPQAKGINNLQTEKFKNVEIRHNNMGYGIGRTLAPFIRFIDDAFFNLSIHNKILASKLAYIIPEGFASDNEKESLEAEMNDWILNGEPLKIIDGSALLDGELPLKKVEIDDATNSFIQTIRFVKAIAHSMIGVPNDNFEDKPERRVAGEIEVQNIFESSTIKDGLNFRQIASKKMNEVFGWNTSVSVDPRYWSEEQEVPKEDDNGNSEPLE